MPQCLLEKAPFQIIDSAVWRYCTSKVCVCGVCVCARVCGMYVCVHCTLNLIVEEKLLVSSKWFQKGAGRKTRQFRSKIMQMKSCHERFLLLLWSCSSTTNCMLLVHVEKGGK